MIIAVQENKNGLTTMDHQNAFNMTKLFFDVMIKGTRSVI